MIIKVLAVLGLSIPFLFVFIQLFNILWEKPRKEMSDQKRICLKPLRIPVRILIICVVLSLAMGYASFRLFNHGKDIENPLVGHLDVTNEYRCSPAYVIYDSKAYRAFTPYNGMHPQHEITLANTNDIDIIVNSIDVVIDNYIETKLQLYRFIVSGMGDAEYDIFYGDINRFEKTSKLVYWGEGLYDTIDYSTSQNETKKFMKLEPNSESIVFPYSTFFSSGLYTIHYIINYNLNGQQKRFILPKQSMYIVAQDEMTDSPLQEMNPEF